MPVYGRSKTIGDSPPSPKETLLQQTRGMCSMTYSLAAVAAHRHYRPVSHTRLHPSLSALPLPFQPQRRAEPVHTLTRGILGTEAQPLDPARRTPMLVQERTLRPLPPQTTTDKRARRPSR